MSTGSRVSHSIKTDGTSDMVIKKMLRLKCT
jgi:hypothetical protein